LGALIPRAVFWVLSRTITICRPLFVFLLLALAVGQRRPERASGAAGRVIVFALMSCAGWVALVSSQPSVAVR
jgi:hypothetical protein